MKKKGRNDALITRRVERIILNLSHFFSGGKSPRPPLAAIRSDDVLIFFDVRPKRLSFLPPFQRGRNYSTHFFRQLTSRLRRRSRRTGKKSEISRQGGDTTGMNGGGQNEKQKCTST